MTLRDDLVAKLEEENDALRVRVRELEELVGLRFEAPPMFRFTRNEATIFGMLLKSRLARKTDIMRQLYFHRQDEADIKIVDVWVCKMRSKLTPFEINIETQWGEGYFLNRDAKARAQALLDEVNA